jgi:hypothetical protein
MEANRLAQQLTEAIDKALGHDGVDGTYIHYLTRCKSAYGWGTMTLDDFTEVDAEFTHELVSAVTPIFRQQQAEIERLNRAYEVLWDYVAWSFGYDGYMRASDAMDKSQRIKEGKDGEQE